MTSPANQRPGVSFSQHEMVGGLAQLSEFLAFFKGKLVVFVAFEEFGLMIECRFFRLGLSDRIQFFGAQALHRQQVRLQFRRGIIDGRGQVLSTL